ncbi:MAG: helix-turn-helix domain-containing protein [Bacteroidaceae bacterium]|nr:helix-turn-helix domain-containing protein [Bacteroidaceae bacterium]
MSSGKLEHKDENGKLRYNFHVSQKESFAYASKISTKQEKTIYHIVLSEVVLNQRYRRADCTSSNLAKEFGLNTSNISAVLRKRFGKTLPELVNECRIKDAITILQDKRFDKTSAAQVGLTVGFGNRQTFYASFYKFLGVSPALYRKLYAQGDAPILNSIMASKTE